MTADGSAETEQDATLGPWDPKRHLRKVDGALARYSRGFLRCRPEKWYPGFAAHWLPLAHSLGIEMKILEAKPVLSVPKGLDFSCVGAVDGEPLSISIDQDSMRTLLDAVAPGGVRGANKIVLEYLARRLLTSLAMCWSGPESSLVKFESEMSPDEVRAAGGVKLAISFNGNPCTIWISLGRLIVDRLDGLWRRQIHAAARRGDEDSVAHFCVAQLAVPPAMLSEYLKSGTVVDLEVPLSDSITMHLGAKPWMSARLCDVDGYLGVEVIPGAIGTMVLPEGTTRLSIEFGTANLPATNVAELSQVGAIWQTDIPVGNQINMVINNEVVGSGTLCTYEGRFAISVR